MDSSIRQADRQQMEADVSAWREETSCQIVYPTALSSANNQLTTGLIHPPRRPADSSWQLVGLHLEETVEADIMLQCCGLKVQYVQKKCIWTWGLGLLLNYYCICCFKVI